MLLPVSVSTEPTKNANDHISVMLQCLKKDNHVLAFAEAHLHKGSPAVGEAGRHELSRGLQKHGMRGR